MIMLSASVRVGVIDHSLLVYGIKREEIVLKDIN